MQHAKEFLHFLLMIGKLKSIQRQGVLYYGFKNADSATDHCFRLAMMAWLFGKGRKLDAAKLFKLALVHDLCKVYTGDLTPYNGLFKKGKNGYRLAWRWRRLSLTEKQRRYKEKFRKEFLALKKLTKNIPAELKKDILETWLDFQKAETPEAKFLEQLDRAENLLEAFECWKQNRKFPTLPWWEHADEVIHDRALLQFLEEIEKEELHGKHST